MRPAVLFCGLASCLIMASCPSEKPTAEPGNPASDVRVVEEFHSNGRLKSSTEAVGKLRHGMSREYGSDGTLEKEILYDRNQKHGAAKTYYADGKTIKMELTYELGRKQGDGKWYYPDGNIYRVTPYVNNAISGIRTTYYENGGMQSETPYMDSEPGIGLKEYTQDGKLKEYRGEIRIREEDQIRQNNTFTLVLSMSDNTRNVKFYRGNLISGAYWTNQLEDIPTENGVGRITFYIAPGSFKMEKINIVARMKSSLDHTRILQKEYHLSVENND